MEEWRIYKDRGRCEKPGCPLTRESEYYAVLQLPECLRVERCIACFEELRQAMPAKLPFHWRLRRNVDDKKAPSLDLESLRGLFDRLGEPVEAGEVANAALDDDADRAVVAERLSGLRYLVALLLLRKRRLKMVDPVTPEQEAADLLVVDPRVEGMEPVCLSAPELGPERFANLREELMVAIGEDPAAQSAADSEPVRPRPLETD